jgi:hypothetical protein
MRLPKLLFSSFRQDDGSYGYALVRADSLKEADDIFNTYRLGNSTQKAEIEHLLYDAVNRKCFSDLPQANWTKLDNGYYGVAAE